MNATLIEAKNNLIKLFVSEIEKVLETKEPVNAYYKIGWVDWVSDDLIQHEFVGIYRANGDLYLVEKDGSEAPKNLKISEVTDILRLEWIYKGLIENAKDKN